MSINLQRLMALRNGHIAAPPDPDMTPIERVMASFPPEINIALTRRVIDYRIDAYVTEDPAMLAMLRRAKLCAFRPEPVLITGETGTGKELVAKILLGDRPDSPAQRNFFPQNCAGIVDTLFESIVFGHVAGSFTGASAQDRPGLLVAAKSGVVFFDEIGELPLSQQAKLLRAIQERCVTPVGSTREVAITCRLIFATHRNLAQMVAAGTFREDLYYRISAMELQTSPLRERPDDAPIIADALCAAKSTKKDPWSAPEEMIPDAVIQSRGNVRALEKWLLMNHVFGEE